MNVNVECDVGEYLDHANCKCRKRLIDKPVKECRENIDEVKMTRITLAEDKIVVNLLAQFMLS